MARKLSLKDFTHQITDTNFGDAWTSGKHIIRVNTQGQFYVAGLHTPATKYPTLAQAIESLSPKVTLGDLKPGDKFKFADENTDDIDVCTRLSVDGSALPDNSLPTKPGYLPYSNLDELSIGQALTTDEVVTYD